VFREDSFARAVAALNDADVAGAAAASKRGGKASKDRDKVSAPKP